MQNSKMNLFRYLRNLSLFFLVALVFFSCEREDFDITEITRDEITPEIEFVNTLMNRAAASMDSLTIDLGCFSIQTPFSVIDLEGNEYVVNGEDEFVELLEDEALIILDFAYPFSIEYEDGEVVSIHDMEELGIAFASCLPDDGWGELEFPAYNINFDNSCYSLVYPLTLIKLDSTSIVISNEQEFASLLAEEELVLFSFPLQLIDEASNTIDVMSGDELINLLVSCGGFEGDSIDIDLGDGFLAIGCYGIDYPINVELVDGTVRTVNDHEELCELMLEGSMLDFVYPYNLLDEDGMIRTVNSEEELFAAFEDCDFDIVYGDPVWELGFYASSDSTGFFECYTINFPIDITAIDFTTNESASITLDSQQALENHIYNAVYIDNAIIYPISVILVENQEEVILESDEDLFALIENCN